jgi:hypothetical protein
MINYVKIYQIDYNDCVISVHNHMYAPGSIDWSGDGPYRETYTMDATDEYWASK